VFDLYFLNMPTEDKRKEPVIEIFYTMMRTLFKIFFI